MPDTSIRLSPRELAALKALAEVYREGEPWALNFKGIASRSGLEPGMVRRSVRALARKGCAEFRRGLFNDSGETAGAGYACTPAGAAYVAALAKKPEVPASDL
jgi:DNA-binding MarR family transcriptional regulator